MKFSVSSAELLRTLEAVGKAVPSKPMMPILEGVRIATHPAEHRISVVATDLELFEEVSCGVRIEPEGTPRSVVLPYKRLVATLRALPDLPVTVSADDALNVTIKTDQGRYKMVGYDGADFPEIPLLGDDATEVPVDGGELAAALGTSAFALSKDALRPSMQGHYVRIHGDGPLTLVATDGHRLVRIVTENVVTEHVPAIRADEAVSFILPADVSSAVRRALGGSSTQATISITSNLVQVAWSGTGGLLSRIVARLIDEVYPNYEAVIPASGDRRLTVNRLSLLAAVRRVGLYASNSTRQLRLELGKDAAGGRVDVLAEDIEHASEAKETVLADFEGETMVIGFNADYLTEVLSNIGVEDIEVHFSSPDHAAVVTPAHQADGEDLLMLVMPVRLLSTYCC